MHKMFFLKLTKNRLFMIIDYKRNDVCFFYLFFVVVWLCVEYLLLVSYLKWNKEEEKKAYKSSTLHTYVCLY